MQEGSTQEASSLSHPLSKCLGSEDLSSQYSLHCHQKGSSVSGRALQVLLLGNTKTGQGILWTLKFDCFSSCLAHQKGVMVSWVSSTRSHKKHLQHSGAKVPKYRAAGGNHTGRLQLSVADCGGPSMGGRQWLRARVQPGTPQCEPPWAKEPELAS